MQPNFQILDFDINYSENGIQRKYAGIYCHFMLS